MSGATGDFGRLQATINALNGLARVPSKVAAVAAPELTKQMQKDAQAARNPYGQAFEEHAIVTVKRWGPHPILDLTGQGIDSLKADPSGGAGIKVTADEHMRFAQGGTVNEPVRAVLPNNPTLPASWREILNEARDKVMTDQLKQVVK